ncbi:hypothetical protein FWD20_02140 [Candidatus Saccharibacteria bacterium]|nr:hypothetical protein [Candidatus Saccharibacteria bacterium]
MIQWQYYVRRIIFTIIIGGGRRCVAELLQRALGGYPKSVREYKEELGDGSAVACMKCLVTIQHDNPDASLVPTKVIDTSNQSSPNRECAGGMVDDIHTPAGILEEDVTKFWRQKQESRIKERGELIKTLGGNVLHCMHCV